MLVPKGRNSHQCLKFYIVHTMCDLCTLTDLCISVLSPLHHHHPLPPPPPGLLGRSECHMTGTCRQCIPRRMYTLQSHPSPPPPETTQAVTDVPAPYTPSLPTPSHLTPLPPPPSPHTSPFLHTCCWVPQGKAHRWVQKCPQGSKLQQRAIKTSKLYQLG